MTYRHKRQTGFTILELTIATAVFSVVLLVIAAGILSFSRGFFKGSNQAQTQETVRSIVDEITQNVQFAKSIDTRLNAEGDGVVCVDNVRYSATPGRRFDSMDPNSHGLIKSPLDGACEKDTSFDSSTDTELLGHNMRLTNLQVESSGNLHRVVVGIIFGDDTVITTPGGVLKDTTCVQGAGSQYCAVAKLDTLVQNRL